jgi:hypothetical protein
MRLSSVPPHNHRYNAVNILNTWRISKTSKEYCKHRGRPQRYGEYFKNVEEALQIQRIL